MLGAEYRPEAETDPAVADHVTEVFVVPVTVAVNCCEPLVRTVAVVGFIETATGALTVTVAEADLVGSAALVAVTV